jgi:hypothetical protein
VLYVMTGLPARKTWSDGLHCVRNDIRCSQ